MYQMTLTMYYICTESFWNQESLNQCPIPINTDQCRSKSWHWSKMPLNADHCWSMPINSDQFLSTHFMNAGSILLDLALIGIERNWSELIDIWINARILNSIERHWSGESCITYPFQFSRTLLYMKVSWWCWYLLGPWRPDIFRLSLHIVNYCYLSGI